MPSMLSTPKKMPGASFSLQAGKTCPSSHATIGEHGDNAICGECYAKGGSYVWSTTIAAQMRRLSQILESIKNDNGDTWVSAMVAEITKATKKEKYFRIHDAGDFFSVEYVNLWVRIAEALPSVKFWAPTREYISKNADMLPALVRLASLPNVVVRPSAVSFDTPSPIVPGLSAGTTVLRSLTVLDNHNVCPSTVKGNDKTCDGNNCRRCWDGTSQVAYVEH